MIHRRSTSDSCWFAVVPDISKLVNLTHVHLDRTGISGEWSPIDIPPFYKLTILRCRQAPARHQVHGPLQLPRIRILVTVV